MTSFDVEEKLKYVHKHAEVTFGDTLEKRDEMKSSQSASKLIIKAETSKSGLEALKYLNIALSTVPETDSKLKNEIESRIKIELKKINISDEIKEESCKRISSKIKVASFYYCSTLNFGIPTAFVFQLEVYYKLDRLQTGLTAQKIGTTARWYSNKTSLKDFH